MPNHVANDLWIKGSKEEIKKFFKGIKQRDRSSDDSSGGRTKLSILASYFPCPPELAEATADGKPKPKLVKKYGFNDWYEWCNTNWGTKWGDYDLEIDKAKGFITFYSAWSPPVAGLTVVSKKFPSLTFKLKYYEAGGGFKGSVTIKNGCQLSYSTGSYRGSRGG